jgi:ABC-2 type transport system ATP-binding protein
VALGIVGRPTLLFLDEPTTGFDPEARRQFWTLIRSLRELGTTMLLTTHYLDEAEALADRVGVIARGRLVEVAVPSSLGGRESAPVVVSWTEDGVRRSEATATPTALVRELGGRFPGEIPDLAVVRPSLEDVYLRMIGEDR